MCSLMCEFSHCVDLYPFIIMGQRMCAGVNGRAYARKMYPIDVDPHLQFLMSTGQMCTREVRCFTCISWTNAQWSLHEVKKHTYWRKVAVMCPSAGSSAMVLSSVHGEQVPHAPQP